jgi:uncharacterized protein YndB with AHSA1/START domain
MARKFEVRRDVEVDATPEEVWEAIATGPGIDSWFMGRTQVDPGERGSVRTTFGAYEPECTVTAWEPLERLAYRTAADEYEAMPLGNELFFATLVEYLTHFAGRTATPLTAFGPPVADWDEAWALLHGALGLVEPVGAGDRARLAAHGLTPTDGVVYFVNADTLAVRTGDALYRFLRGFHGPMVAGHHLFATDVDPEQATRAWQSWLTQLFA